LYGSTSPSSSASSTSNNVSPNNSGGLSSPTNTAANWTGMHCANRLLGGFFDCPKFQRNGHTDSISYQFFQSGTGMDSLHLTIFDTSAIAYTHDSITFADTGGHHIDATVVVLDSVVTWNSTRSGTIKSVRIGNVTKTYQLASNDTTTNVQFYLPRSRYPYPISGTLIRNYMVTRTREGSDTTHYTAMQRVVVTFNGTKTPQMTVDGTSSYNLDLLTAQVTHR